MKFSLGQLLRFGMVSVAAGLLSLASVASAADLPVVKELLLKVKDGVKVDTLVMYPEVSQPDPLGVVVMNHGFLLSNQYYREVLARIAAQGFVIVAPQTIAPGGLPIGKPSTAVEAKTTVAVLDFLNTRLGTLVNHAVDFDKLALVNHSRGSKIAWTMLRDGMVNAKAVAAMDPVDGTMDGTALSTTGIQLKIPAMIVGTGLGSKSGGFGQACAPANVNYNLFWNTVTTSPSWLFVANDFGHIDLLDEKISCGLTCSVCAKATKDHPTADLRNWLGDSIGAFLRGTLYGDSTSLESVENNPLNLSLTKANR